MKTSEVPPAFRLDNNFNVKADLTIESQEWHFLNINIKEFLESIVSSALSIISIKPEFFDISISFLLADDETLKNLNLKYRNKNNPTNVLSFPYQKVTPDNLDIISSNHGKYLGDIAISYERILEESITYEKSFIEHFTYIVIHAVLHLLGYDHILDKDAEAMEKMEIRILNYLGYDKKPSFIIDELPKSN